jgi:hypothetical protein
MTNLPANPLVLVDTSVLLAAQEKSDTQAHIEPSKAILELLDGTRARPVVSIVTLVELRLRSPSPYIPASAKTIALDQFMLEGVDFQNLWAGRDTQQSRRTCVKADILIVASAVAHSVDLVVAWDHGMLNTSKRAGLSALNPTEALALLNRSRGSGPGAATRQLHLLPDVED